MELTELIGQVTGFDNASPRDRIRLFAWFLHTYKRKEAFSGTDVRACFSELHIATPNVSQYIARMVGYGDLVKGRDGLKLERAVRTALDLKFGMPRSVVQVSKILAELPGRVPDLAEKNFLAEAIKCYRIEAYRACVVMVWNLAYSHLLHWILRDTNRQVEFNLAISRRYPKKATIKVVNYDNFLDELKESEVIEICGTSRLINGNVVRILKEKLGRRNTAAHPASVVVTQSQADDVVTDLVNNVVLLLT